MSELQNEVEKHYCYVLSALEGKVDFDAYDIVLDFLYWCEKLWIRENKMFFEEACIVCYENATPTSSCLPCCSRDGCQGTAKVCNTCIIQMSTCPFCRENLDLSIRVFHPSKKASKNAIVKAILEAKKFDLSKLFSLVICHHDFEEAGPTYELLLELSKKQNITWRVECDALTGPSRYLMEIYEKHEVFDRMKEMPRLTASFLVNAVRPLVGKEFDDMFVLSFIAFFLDAVKDVAKHIPDDHPIWKFYWRGSIKLSDYIDKKKLKEKMDLLGIPKDNENRLECEDLMKALE